MAAPKTQKPAETDEVEVTEADVTEPASDYVAPNLAWTVQTGGGFDVPA
ncbi:hypothetical protein [Streptomyces sp. NPDC002088]